MNLICAVDRYSTLLPRDMLFFFLVILILFSAAIDTADGQTTSPQPAPFTLARTLDPTAPSTSTQSSCDQPQTADRSESPPATLNRAPASDQRPESSSFQEVAPPSPPTVTVDSTTPPVQLHPQTVQCDSEMSPEPSPSPDVLPSPAPPAGVSVSSQHTESQRLCTNTTGDAEPFEELDHSDVPPPEQLCSVQPMEQETTDSQAEDSTLDQPGSVEMESVEMESSVVTPERDQPEGELCSRSDSIPSLAAALKELHELLVNNNQSQNRSSSCSPSDPLRQSADEAAVQPRSLTPDAAQPGPSAAVPSGAQPSEAKANHHAAVSGGGPSECGVPGLCDQEACLLECHDSESRATQPPPHRQDDSTETKTEGCEPDEADVVVFSLSEPGASADLAGDLEFREPPEGQPERGVADGHDSGANAAETLDLQSERTSLGPLSMAAASPDEDSNISSSSAPPFSQAPPPASAAPRLPSPHPFVEQFPAEHIQRIQAAGFSASEAAEALEQADGVVELALLALLARSITVPM